MRVVVSLPASGFTVAVCGAQTNQKSLRKCPNPASIGPRLGHILAQLRELHRTVLPHWPGQPPFGVPPLPQANAWAIAAPGDRAGIATRIGNHTIRATRITAYRKNGGTPECAATMANHASMRTRQLYERRSEDITPDEVKHVLI
jgi:integrase